VIEAQTTRADAVTSHPGRIPCMKNDFAVLFILVVFGVYVKKLTWKHWYLLVLFIMTWMAFTVWRDK
jgi:hypothetical protein